MFFSIELLSREGRGKFAIVWLAAHEGVRKITNGEIQSVNIATTVDDVLAFIRSNSSTPNQRFSLRISANLMLGVITVCLRQIELTYKTMLRENEEFLRSICPLITEQKRMINQKKAEKKQLMTLTQKKRKPSSVIISPWESSPEKEQLQEQHTQGLARIEDITLVEVHGPRKDTAADNFFGDEVVLQNRIEEIETETLAVDLNQRLTLGDTGYTADENAAKKRKREVVDQESPTITRMSIAKQPRVIENLDAIEVVPDTQQTVPAEAAAMEQAAAEVQTEVEVQTVEQAAPALVEIQETIAKPARLTAKQRKANRRKAQRFLDKFVITEKKQFPERRITRDHATIPATNKIKEDELEEQEEEYYLFSDVPESGFCSPNLWRNINKLEEIAASEGKNRKQERSKTGTGSMPLIREHLTPRGTLSASKIRLRDPSLVSIESATTPGHGSNGRISPQVQSQSGIGKTLTVSVPLENIAEEPSLLVPVPDLDAVMELSSVAADVDFAIELPTLVCKPGSYINIYQDRINHLKKHLANIFQRKGAEVVDIYELLPRDKITRAVAATTISDLLVLKSKKYVVLHGDENHALIGFSRGQRTIYLV